MSKFTDPTSQRHHDVRPLDRTKLAMVSRIDAADAAHGALFPIQDEPPELVIAGIAVLFATLVQRCGLDPEDTFRLGDRIVREREAEDRTNESLQSLRDFAGLRLLGQEVTVG